MATVTKQQLIEEIEALPAEALPELSKFMEYLRYKATHEVETVIHGQASSSGFLLSIAGIGSSDEQDLSERDEEILAKEIDPKRGWGLEPDTHK